MFNPASARDLWQFEMRVLPFGLKTAHGPFQAYDNAVFDGRADERGHDANYTFK